MILSSNINLMQEDLAAVSLASWKVLGRFPLLSSYEFAAFMVYTIFEKHILCHQLPYYLLMR